jgi:hypothetical protein
VVGERWLETHVFWVMIVESRVGPDQRWVGTDERQVGTDKLGRRLTNVEFALITNNGWGPINVGDGLVIIGYGLTIVGRGVTNIQRGLANVGWR